MIFTWKNTFIGSMTELLHSMIRGIKFVFKFLLIQIKGMDESNYQSGADAPAGVEIIG